MKYSVSSYRRGELENSSLLRSRRRFVQGLLGSGLAGTGLGSCVTRTLNVEQTGVGSNLRRELAGREFNLVIEEKAVNYTGSPRTATAINGSIPAPTLRWKEGDEVTVNVTNRLSEPTSIHWHGMILPYQMDGVPGISFPGIAPGQTFRYRFKVQQSGTYWYHSHSAFQEMTGMYGAIIIEPADGESIAVDRDHLVMLSEWTDENPKYVFQKLKTMGHLYNFNQSTLPQLMRDIQEYGLQAAINRRDMFNVMRMKPTDLGDLSAATLTYLMNGLTPEDNETRLYEKGQSVRLRFINAAGNTFFDVRIPELPMTVVRVDGLDIEPVTIDEFRVGPGEAFDVIVRPVDDAYTIFAETMERTGYARGTLAVRPGLSAPIPEPRQIQWLSMADMMGNMAAMDGSATGMMHGEGDHGTMQMAGSDPVRARHATTEFGPSTDMRVDYPRTNLDDPGVGLRETSRRVLTLADLRSLDREAEAQAPEREIELHLTGNMERYSWSIDGLEYSKSTPVHFRHGERLRVHLHNDTMMTH
ncbi:MAG: copper resistance system multicopper oxidase, partial [Pseudomonadales bacterium]|nr:copper resistance system multicopper oxidase [Pseudomonadales bacterium]